ncbi:hypothetical protein AX774_g439 [Zancudomyces culisetae]|uniref:Uncharacterized protein n=1 Tax=Zancudomyces culisetae TaxID=1213189 RepID=A0A1R1PYD7_ZANCU|nr:hypothetical protein AX774_g439 [Zancudomyces culisetae]|eukprot:OMH85975.1 hypothetical protein AX774_g439 [Zancudomyces culisetae]
MVKSTLALLTVAVATVSVNAAYAPRPRENVGPMQPPMEQVQDLGKFASPARPAFNRRFAIPPYRKRADEEEEAAPADDTALVQSADAPEDGDAVDETDDRWWGYYGYPCYGGYYGYRYPYYSGYYGRYYRKRADEEGGAPADKPVSAQDSPAQIINSPGYKINSGSETDDRWYGFNPYKFYGAYYDSYW